MFLIQIFFFFVATRETHFSIFLPSTLLLYGHTINVLLSRFLVTDELVFSSSHIVSVSPLFSLVISKCLLT
jgi:hypothetical protein